MQSLIQGVLGDIIHYLKTMHMYVFCCILVIPATVFHICPVLYPEFLRLMIVSGSNIPSAQKISKHFTKETRIQFTNG